MNVRVKPTKETEKEVLVASQRRCCLCYYLDDKREPRRGHTNRNRSRSQVDDLVWLCLDHHDQFDSRTSQSKNLMREEVRHYRDRLHRELGSGLHTQKAAGDQRLLPPRTMDRFSGSLRTVLERANNAFDYFFEPWRAIAWLEERRPFLFAYKSPNRCDGVCKIERLRESAINSEVQNPSARRL